MSDNPNGKKFLRSRKQNSMWMAITVFGFIALALGLFAGSGGGVMGLPIALGIIMLVTKNKPLLMFSESHFEFKFTLFSPLVMAH
jgi:hypothetical protein